MLSARRYRSLCVSGVEVFHHLVRRTKTPRQHCRNRCFFDAHSRLFSLLERDCTIRVPRSQLTLDTQLRPPAALFSSPQVTRLPFLRRPQCPCLRKDGNSFQFRRSNLDLAAGYSDPQPIALPERDSLTQALVYRRTSYLRQGNRQGGMCQSAHSRVSERSQPPRS